MIPHTAFESKEKQRIYNHQGEVKVTEDGQALVCMRGRTLPALHVTRSIGDLVAHQIGVTSEPSFQMIKSKAENRFVFVASSGLW